MIHLPQFFKLDDGCWCATAQIAFNTQQSADSNLGDSQRHQPTNHTLNIQRLAVRALCQALMSHLNITDDIDERSFPYRLSQAGHYLCFSHSQSQVAVILNTQRPSGVDIEAREVSWRLAQRFYHDDEITQLQNIEPPLCAQLCRHLWQIKECLVKIEQTTLIATLGQSCAQLIPEIINAARINELTSTHYPCQSAQQDNSQQLIVLSETLLVNQDSYRIGLILAEQLVVIF
ncbi:4'-phosphopantetheinyl transferase family protein [Psychrobacter pygoscelis]|uniref:4'-phosphopantetheinyl transferase family protein n=1 Tax=Psychrobacter pygoscelis TaxID=2488563 RepID=UPI00103D9F14|nr:4'-phosphopantetheinyl transferase superfamily protein [Psychrobacter pygoscelis]